MSFLGRPILWLAVCFGLAYWCYVPLPEQARTVSKYANCAFGQLLGIPSAIIGLVSKRLSFEFNCFLVTKVLSGLVNEDMSQFEKRDFDGVAVTVYGRPKRQGHKYSAILYIHGWGWTLGSVKQYHPHVRHIWNHTDVILFSVEYRLAPQHIFPAAFDDCYTAARYLLQHAESFDVDPSKIAIAGDSAGGNLAAAVAIKLRDEKITPPLTHQLLIYPVTQCFDFNTPSYDDLRHLPLFMFNPFRETMGQFWLSYMLGSEWTNQDLADLLDNKHVDSKTWDKYKSFYNTDDPGVGAFKPTRLNEELAGKLHACISNPYAAPLAATHLRNLPDTYLIYGGWDVLMYDAHLYANRLERDGVNVTRAFYPHFFHGDCNYSPLINSPYTALALEAFINYINNNM